MWLLLALCSSVPEVCTTIIIIIIIIITIIIIIINKGKLLSSFIKLSQVTHLVNVWRTVWRMYMWILGLKGLRERVDCSTKDIINQQLGTLSNDDGDGYGDVT